MQIFTFDGGRGFGDLPQINRRSFEPDPDYAKNNRPSRRVAAAVGEKLVNTNTKYSLKYNSAPIYLRGDITISYVKGQALPSYLTSSLRISVAPTVVKGWRGMTWLPSGVAGAAEPRYPQGPGNNYEAQLKTREKLCPIFIIIHLSRIEFTLGFSLRYSRPHKHAKIRGLAKKKSQALRTCPSIVILPLPPSLLSHRKSDLLKER